MFNLQFVPQLFGLYGMAQQPLDLIWLTMSFKVMTILYTCMFVFNTLFYYCMRLLRATNEINLHTVTTDVHINQ